MVYRCLTSIDTSSTFIAMRFCFVVMMTMYLFSNAGFYHHINHHPTGLNQGGDGEVKIAIVLEEVWGQRTSDNVLLKGADPLVSSPPPPLLVKCMRLVLWWLYPSRSCLVVPLGLKERRRSGVGSGH